MVMFCGGNSLTNALREFIFSALIFCASICVRWRRRTYARQPLIPQRSSKCLSHRLVRIIATKVVVQAQWTN
jgi:hypothetical protein